MGYLGETFHKSPSDYMDEPLSAYERFCIDEAALLVLAKEKKASYDREKEKMDRKQGRGKGKGKPQAGPSEEPSYADPAAFAKFTAQAKRAKKDVMKKAVLKG